MATTNYANLATLTRAAERLIEELGRGAIEHQRDYDHYSARVDSIVRQLNAPWSSPADVADARALKCRLVDAWNATGGVE